MILHIVFMTAEGPLDCCIVHVTGAVGTTNELKIKKSFFVQEFFVDELIFNALNHRILVITKNNTPLSIRLECAITRSAALFRTASLTRIAAWIVAIVVTIALVGHELQTWTIQCQSAIRVVIAIIIKVHDGVLIRDDTIQAIQRYPALTLAAGSTFYHGILGDGTENSTLGEGRRVGCCLRADIIIEIVHANITDSKIISLVTKIHDEWFCTEHVVRIDEFLPRLLCDVIPCTRIPVPHALPRYIRDHNWFG